MYGTYTIVISISDTVTNFSLFSCHPNLGQTFLEKGTKVPSKRDQSSALAAWSVTYIPTSITLARNR